MTNILATITLTVVTNWTTIGTYTPVAGYQREDVQQGVAFTNTVMEWTWKGKTNWVTIESQQGSVVGERRVPIPVVKWFQAPNIIFTNIDLIPKMFWTNRNEAVLLNAVTATNALRDAPDNRLNLMTP